MYAYQVSLQALFALGHLDTWLAATLLVQEVSPGNWVKSPGRPREKKRSSNLRTSCPLGARNDSYSLVYLNHAKWQVEEICLREGASGIRSLGSENLWTLWTSETMEPIGTTRSWKSWTPCCHQHHQLLTVPGVRIHHTR